MDYLQGKVGIKYPLTSTEEMRLKAALDLVISFLLDDLEDKPSERDDSSAGEDAGETAQPPWLAGTVEKLTTT
jgi:hypothetical protein